MLNQITNRVSSIIVAFMFLQPLFSQSVVGSWDGEFSTYTNYDCEGDPFVSGAIVAEITDTDITTTMTTVYTFEGLCSMFGGEIDDEGLVSIAAVNSESGKAAVDWINEIIEEPEIGKIYEGKVVKLMDFGAFVNFMGSRDGLVHISQLKKERVEKVSDVINEGDVVKVKVLDIDSRGKVKLSMKEVETE